MHVGCTQNAYNIQGDCFISLEVIQDVKKQPMGFFILFDFWSQENGCALDKRQRYLPTNCHRVRIFKIIEYMLLRWRAIEPKKVGNISGDGQEIF